MKKFISKAFLSFEMKGRLVLTLTLLDTIFLFMACDTFMVFQTIIRMTTYCLLSFLTSYQQLSWTLCIVVNLCLMATSHILEQCCCGLRCKHKNSAAFFLLVNVFSNLQKGMSIPQQVQKYTRIDTMVISCCVK